MMTISHMCDAYDVIPRTLRFSEAKELVNPVRQATKRLFTRQCRARLKRVLRGKRFVFTLDELRPLLGLYDQGAAAQLEKTCKGAARHLGEIEARRHELDLAIEELRDDRSRGLAEFSRLNRPRAGVAA
jgi:DNA-binding transcriptional MerR regulator